MSTDKEILVQFPSMTSNCWTSTTTNADYPYHIGNDLIDFTPTPKIKGEPMATLFNIIIVSKDRDILIDTKVVAEDEEEAKFSVDIHSILINKRLKPKDVTILCNSLGEVKVRKEVQKVKIVDKDDE